MEIRYFNRQQGGRFSIEKVTTSIIDEVAKQNDVISFMVPNLHASFSDIIKNIVYVYKHRTHNGINHITGDIHYCILALIGCKSVLTIHDTVFLTVKQNKISHFAKWLLWLYLPCLLADKIICISDKTKAELEKHHISTDKVQVISDPVTLVKVNPSLLPKTKIQILHIGTKTNKNLSRVIDSLTGLDCELTIIGELGEKEISQLNKNQIVYRNLVGISEEELSETYMNSDIVSFPSLYEGFGMPIIEGQLSDCVVLTSKISPMTEVGLNSVYYVDPYDVDSIRLGFSKLIDDVELRKNLIRLGRINARRFSPDLIAKQYLELYKSM